MLKRKRLLMLLIALGLINTRIEAVNYTTPLTGTDIFLTGADEVNVTGSGPAISVTAGGAGLQITGAPTITYTSGTVNRNMGIRGIGGAVLQLGTGTKIRINDAMDGIYYSG